MVSPPLLVKVLHNQGKWEVFTPSGLCYGIFKHWLQNNSDLHTKQTHCGFFTGEAKTVNFPVLEVAKDSFGIYNIF